MALDLVARISLTDNFTRRFNRVTRSMSSLGSAVNAQAKQLTGLKTQILGVAAGFATAAGAAKAFNATIGEAAKFEASKVAIEAIFNDKSLSDSYLKVVDKMAIDSPLLNSSDMMSSSKGLIAMTKNVDDLAASWGIIEKLMVLDPTKGTSEASFSLKEMFQGDSLSMVEQFGLNKKELNRIKKLSIPQQIAEINGLLNGMGVTEEAINKMGNTTLGRWAQIQERAEGFMRSIGAMGNSKIGSVLGDVIEKFDKFDSASLAAKLDSAIGGGIQKVIDFAKKIYELRAPILAVAKIIGMFVGTVASIVGVVSVISAIGSAIAFLGSPIGLLALGILGISAAFKEAYAKVKPFRDIVNTVAGTVLALFADLSGRKADSMDIMTRFGLGSDQIKGVFEFSRMIKDALGRVSNAFTALVGGDGVGAMTALGFSPDMIAKVTDFIDVIKTKAGEFVAFLSAKWAELQPSIMSLIGNFMSMKDTAIGIFASLWGFLQPIFGALMNAFYIVADVVVIAFNNIIAPAINFTIALFQALWKIVGPVLKLIGAAIGFNFGLLKIAWETVIKPFVNFMTSAFKNAFEMAIPSIEKIGAAFDVVGGIISQIAGWLNDFTGALSRFKVPNWLQKLGGGGTVKFEETTSDGQKKSHYNGIDYIPYNGYQATLHKGEKIVTAQENREGKANAGSPISISGNTFHVRQESDVEAIAMQLARLIESERAQMT